MKTFNISSAGIDPRGLSWPGPREILNHLYPNSVNYKDGFRLRVSFIGSAIEGYTSFVLEALVGEAVLNCVVNVEGEPTIVLSSTLTSIDSSRTGSFYSAFAIEALENAPEILITPEDSLEEFARAICTMTR